MTRVPLPGTLTCNSRLVIPGGRGLHSARRSRRRRPASVRHRSSSASSLYRTQSKRRAHRLHHPSVVPAARHGAVPPRVSRPAARHRRPADRLGPGRLSRPSFGPGRRQRRDSPCVHGRALHRDDRGREPGVRPALPRSRHRDERAFADAPRGTRRARSCWPPTSSWAANAAPRSAPSARPAITPSATARWASASSTTSRSARRTRCRSTGSSAWRSSISTSITATAPRTSFPTIREC